jgi:hypothetical protein
VIIVKILQYGRDLIYFFESDKELEFQTLIQNIQGPGNLELIVRYGVLVATKLIHFTGDTSQYPIWWSDPVDIPDTDKIRADISLIQSIGGNQDFHLVGGYGGMGTGTNWRGLAHFVRRNQNPPKWLGPNIFSEIVNPTATRRISLIENLTKGPGNFELVALEDPGRDLTHRLYYYTYDQNAFPYSWQGPFTII